MAKKLQLRGGTTSEHSSFTGAVREVTVDTDLKTLRVHDGSTAGGTRLAKFSEIASGSIANVVEDTTPQLGGDLDLNSNNITGTGSIPAGNLTGALPAIDGSSLTGLAAFPSGTKMLFQQTSAPTGWTKDTTNYNDHALRVVTGTVSSGGSSAFSTALATPSVTGSVTGNPSSNLAVSISGNIANHTLSVNQIPAHSHVRNIGGGSSNIRNTAAGANNEEVNINNRNTGNRGGNQAHNHGHNLSGSLSGNLTAGNLAFGSGTASINVNYVDVIVATKD